MTEDGGYLSFDEMSADEFRRFQLKCLDILVYFKEFCEAHKLTFFLGGGTAIGALRHKGFIPWDEDIDVFMPRPDYEKLTRIWKDNADTSRYIFCRTTAEHNFHHAAASIMDVNTTYIMARNKDSDIPQGIVMDVIPLDGCPDSSFARKRQLYNAYLFSLFNNQRLPENKSRKIYLMCKFIYGVIRSKRLRDRIWKKAERKMTKYQFYNNEYITELIGSIHGMKTKHPLSDFTDVVYLDFEGHRMPIMKGYERYMSIIHGDYMTPPPVDQRRPKVNAVYINLDKPYTEFKGKYYMVPKDKKPRGGDKHE